ncbi:hypothetical protein [Thalassomonas haliotis]|uniref:Uncharacterized protein n=1 Tax=Thalassomonas haliotis TaxID=485448 RepID=A0ABY7V8T2_9GAMM|nr:hypothetical protein [Thalassomonas haliotis]WDE09720.1 hypothetical protein H3N35_15480 [Thalassomonas haliotis]
MSLFLSKASKSKVIYKWQVNLASIVTFTGFAQETMRISTGEALPDSLEKHQGDGQTLYIVTTVSSVFTWHAHTLTALTVSLTVSKQNTSLKASARD